ncbi:alpha-kinase [Aureococcus anophagefferens]|nr:alpha-kinase [Aureococcus anophagefferens]
MASLVEHGPKYALFKKSVWSVVNQLKQQGNVWDKYALHERPAERVLRHRYDAESESWKEDLVLFKVSDGAFDEGAMRRCFRAKKNAFGHVIRFHALDWKRGSNYISEAGLWAADYNRSRPPKPIKMIQCCAVEFVDRPGRPVYCAERFIDGTDAFGDTFVKHNTNSGWTDTNQQRLTPEAFSAHSFYASRGDVLVCDIQGVGDLFTDPQLHSCDESHGDGDLGRRGMALFFASSDGSNELMKLLEIPTFALTAAERRRAARAAAPAKARSPSRRSSAIRTVALPKKPETVSDRDAKRSENALEKKNASKRRGKRASIFVPPKPTTPETSPALTFAPVARRRGRRDACEGRFTDDAPDGPSALFHAAFAARCGDARAAYALARWHQGMPHPLLPASPDRDVDLPPSISHLSLDEDAEVEDDPAPSTARDPALAGPLLALAAARGHEAALARAAKESEIPNFKGSYLGRFPLALAAVAVALLDDDAARGLGLGAADLATAAALVDVVVGLRDAAPPVEDDVGALYAAGDAVEANYGLEGHFYPGTIAKDHGDGTFDIDYDDGEQECRVSMGALRPAALAAKRAGFAVGDAVEADYGSEGHYYPGTVAAVHGDGTYDVDYDDCEEECRVSAAAIRGGAKPAGLAVGAAVEADYGLKGHWYPGKIAAAHDGTYDIDYDDGEQEFGVAAAADAEDDDVALPLALHDIVARLAEACEAAGQKADARAHWERAATIAAKAVRGRARSGTFLMKAQAHGDD